MIVEIPPRKFNLGWGSTWKAWGKNAKTNFRLKAHRSSIIKKLKSFQLTVKLKSRTLIYLFAFLSTHFNLKANKVVCIYIERTHLYFFRFLLRKCLKHKKAGLPKSNPALIIQLTIGFICWNPFWIGVCNCYNAILHCPMLHRIILPLR